MLSTDLTRAAIWEDGDASCMARVQVAGANITQATTASVTRRIYDLDGSTPTVDTENGGNGTALTVASVVFDTLQTDARWTEDETGYNFRDDLPGTKFPTSDHRYAVRYDGVSSTGVKWFAGFVLSTRNVWS